MIAKTALPILMALALTGCASMLALNDLSSLTRETTLEQFHTTIKQKPESQKIVVYNNANYRVETYTVQTGTATSWAHNGTQSFPVTVPIGDTYHFIFKENRLEWWGFSADMRKSSDTTIVALADSLIPAEQEK